MVWRQLCHHDLVQCLNIDLRSSGQGILGRQRALAIWQDLIDDPAFGSAVIETTTTSGIKAVVSFGASLFVDSKYINAELSSPTPDLNSRLFHSIASGTKVIRPRATLTSRRKEDALDLVLLCNSFLLHMLNDQKQVEVGLLLPQALLHLHVGFPIGRILMETTNERMRVLATQSGVWKPIADFPDCGRALFMATQQELFASAGFALLAPLFHWKFPLLQLRDGDKHLLSEALNGETDTQLAQKMNLSKSSIKKRWASLFVHVAEVMPTILPEDMFASDQDRRGSQKRHHVLSYARHHPEELRPFRSYPKPD